MILDYTNNFAIYFSSAAESLIYLFFCTKFEDRYKDIRIRIFLGTVLAVCVTILHLQYYSFSVQCPIMLALMGGYLFAAKKCTWKDIFFMAVTSILLQEISHMFADDVIRNWLFGKVLAYGKGSREAYFDVALYILIYLLLSRIYKRYTYKPRRTQLRWRELLVPCLSAVPFFYLRHIYYSLFAPGEADHQIYALLMIMGILALVQIVLVEYFIYEHINHDEREKMEILLKSQQQKYQLQNESARNVNRNYHDLKHILLAYGNSPDHTELQGYLEKMKQEIQPYEAMIHTGNETVDILMADKIHKAQKKGVRIVPFIDGRCLGLINSIDLSVILGNVIDNAIEASEKVKDSDRRGVYIKIAEEDSFVIMRFENWYESINADLSTTKTDPDQHGYGIASVRMLVEQYKGTLTIETDHHQFIVTIMLPSSVR